MNACRLRCLTRLLLVDDEKDNLTLFKDILTGCGFVVDTYYDPVQALLAFKPDYYDLLILDYLMPQLNGIELFKRLRETRKVSKTNVTYCKSRTNLKLRILDSWNSRLSENQLRLLNSFRKSIQY